jgi:hypothetical protein
MMHAFSRIFSNTKIHLAYGGYVIDHVYYNIDNDAH